MNKEKNNESTSADLNCSETTKERTKPKCKRCAAHKKTVMLKGHKRYCKYQNCTCRACITVVTDQTLSARNIARKRALDNDKKGIAPGEIEPPTPWYSTPVKKHSFHLLTSYIMQEIQRSGYMVLNNPGKMWYILARLNQYAYEMEVEYYNETAQEFVADIARAIYGYPMIYSQEACCYLSPSTIMAKVGSPNAGQPIDIKYPLPNSTSASLFPENSFEPPTELPTKQFKYPRVFKFISLFKSSTEPSTEFFTDPSTYPSTESSICSSILASSVPENSFEPPTEPPTKRFKSSTEPFTESSTDSSTSPSTESSICPLASSFPENSFKPLTEPPTKRFKSSTEPSTEPSTYPSTESSKYNYRSIADNQWSKSTKETCRIPKKIASPTK